MSSFNFGINCEDAKKAQALHNFIAALNINQDGLDTDEERVTVIASQALLKELKSYSGKNVGDLKVELWPSEMEFDDAESEGHLEVYELPGKVTKSTATNKVFRFKTYSGNKSNLEKFVAWVQDNAPDKFEFKSAWEPNVDGGSWGVEYQCADSKFDKVADKIWMAKGVVSEKMKN